MKKKQFKNLELNQESDTISSKGMHILGLCLPLQLIPATSILHAGAQTLDMTYFEDIYNILRSKCMHACKVNDSQFPHFVSAAANNMDPIRPPSPGDLGDHFVDIHEVFQHEEPPEAGPGTSAGDATVINENNRSIDRRMSKSIRSRVQHQQRGFNRQVSLATGFSVMNGESRSRRERRVLARGGISFGGFSSADPQVVEDQGGGGGQKGDFRLFRTKTKPPMNKQISLMHTRKDRETESSDVLDNDNVPTMEESVLKAVPAVRYFAALRGPELDEVKV